MATITSNGTGGGLASAGSSWAGGVVPVEGDKVIIAAGDTITLDGNYTWGERRVKKGKHLDEILKQAMEQIIHGNMELTPETSAAKAVEIVKPYIETNQADSIAPVSSIDWKGIEADSRKVAELLKLWQERLEAIEEEELLILAAYEYYY